MERSWFHLGPNASSPINRFSRFFGAHERDQQRDRQTDHATLSVATGHIYAMHAMLSKNTTRSMTVSKAELTCPAWSSCRAVTGADAVPPRDITGDVLLTGRSSLLVICRLTRLPCCLNARCTSSWISRGNTASRHCSNLSITHS